MRNTKFLLISLVLTLGCSISHAQKSTFEVTHPEVKKASFTSDTSDSSQYDELETQIVVYSLIIGIYTLYWFKQKA